MPNMKDISTISLNANSLAQLINFITLHYEEALIFETYFTNRSFLGIPSYCNVSCIKHYADNRQTEYKLKLLLKTGIVESLL